MRRRKNIQRTFCGEASVSFREEGRLNEASKLVIRARGENKSVSRGDNHDSDQVLENITRVDLSNRLRNVHGSISGGRNGGRGACRSNGGLRHRLLKLVKNIREFFVEIELRHNHRNLGRAGTQDGILDLSRRATFRWCRRRCVISRLGSLGLRNGSDRPFRKRDRPLEGDDGPFELFDELLYGRLVGMDEIIGTFSTKFSTKDN